MLTYVSHALQGDPYTIHFFLGKVSDLEIISRTEFIAKDPKYVGRVFTFTARMNDATNQRCGNCAQQAENGALSTAQIPITIPLLKQAIDPDIHGITDIKPDSVERYLIANLGWIATDVSFLFLFAILSALNSLILSLLGRRTNRTTQ